MESTAEVRSLCNSFEMEWMSPITLMYFNGEYFTDGMHISPSLHADIDECELGIDDCHVNATCADVVGGFLCTCNNGFDGNGVNCTSKRLMWVLQCEGVFPHLH